MGTAPQYVVSQGECTTIHTGGMLPKGADAVVMVEHTQSVGSEDIEVYRSVGNRENVLSTGEEVGKGDEILPARKRLRPADIGSLMALGIMRIQVSCRPRVGIISSGDEVVSPDQTPEPGQVRDVNAYTLDAIVQEAGGIPKRYGIIPDDDVILENKARLALSENDIVVITAGSSASVRDLTSTVINRLGIPGVIVHGVNVRPGKPTILAVCQNKAVVGLPGNPVSAYVIAKLFVLPAIRQFLGVSIEDSALRIKAKLTVNLPSQAGREEWIPVRLKKVEISKQEVILADPIYAKSNFITNLVRADGFVRLHSDATGISANEEVEVYPI
jgi:molybdopterin molybdotransferase